MGEASLLGKTALVTGASRGLGLAIATRLAAEGANLALVGRDATALAAAGKVAGNARVDKSQMIGCDYLADLADERQTDSAVERCLRDFGSIDVLVNNAAIQGPIGSFESADWQSWKRVFEVDLMAPARLCRPLLPGMRSRRWGKIVNISGGGATSARPDFSAYACAKTALVRLTESLAEELKGSGVDVNAVAPGPMNTRMLEETLAAGPDGATREYRAALVRSKEGGTPPEKAAELVRWLASPVSDGITGRLISAVWDDWPKLAQRREELAQTDVYTLRRIVPKDRGLSW